MKTLSVFGLVLCWTVLCQGVHVFHALNGEPGPPDLDEQLLDLLRLDELNLDTETETCTENSECLYGGTCEGQDGSKTCNCKSGLSGYNCKIITECETGGKYVNCKEGKGECLYDKDNQMAFCNCSGNMKLNPVTNACEACNCGEKTESCDFSDEGAKQCSCQSGFALKNDICTETCTENSECLYGGTCEGDDGSKTCSCKLGLSGYNCKIITECETGKKYENCKEGKGECLYDEDNQLAICNCSENMKLNPVTNICEDCTCGEKMESCEFSNKGAKQCSCQSGFALKNKICTECNCGEKTEVCKFSENGEKRCTCQSGFALRNDICIGSCSDDSECLYEGSCVGEDGSKTCNCTSGVSGHNCTIIDECEAEGKYKNCKEGKGECVYDEGNQVALCKCSGDMQLNPVTNVCEVCTCGENMESCEFSKKGVKACSCKSGFALKNDICTATCSDDCKHNGTCQTEKGTNRFCSCLEGFRGDKCEIIKACETGEFKNCKEDKGICEFSDEQGEVVCRCEDEKVIDNKYHVCRASCSDTSDCKKGTCMNSLCQCPDGYSGDYCEIIDACVPLKCEDAGANCNYNDGTKEAKCVCEDPNYTYNEKKKHCKTALWCEPNPCKGEDAKCHFEKEKGGECKCLSDQYYDYQAEKCTKINLCIANDNTCEKNKVCDSISGECICPKGYQTSKDECIPNFCKAGPCFSSAECSETERPGIVKCFCDEKSFFKDGCKDGSCFLPGYKRNCTKPCPSGTVKNDGGCEPPSNKACDKDCGYGWCVKTGTEFTCICMDKIYTEFSNESDKCVLKAKAVCASQEVSSDDPLKCNCSGIYKTADNEITCEKKTCADEDVVEECKAQNAYCVDNWKSMYKGYECKCYLGYQRDSNGICRERCSLPSVKEECAANSQSCFQKNDGNLDCLCPPTFSLKTISEKESTCVFDLQKNEFMIYNLPVISNKYVNADFVDKVKLSKDIIDAMNGLFLNKELKSAHLYSYKKDENVLLCDVWLNFHEGIDQKTVKRWESQLLEKNYVSFIPPALILSSENFNSVEHKHLEFCSDTVSKIICGHGSTCENNKKCSCKPGYREVESTLKKYGDNIVVRCEDIDECTEGNHECPINTRCVNLVGDYFCTCLEGYKKSEGPINEENKIPCTDVCNPNPCIYGSCEKINNTVDCQCNAGYGGSLCQRQDSNFKKAANNTVVVGAILGTLLGVTLILFLLYIRRQRKNSYSEDFTPAPPAEMVERRPMRGVTNKAYM